MTNLKDIKFLTIDTESDVVGEDPNPWNDKLVLIQYRYNGVGPVTIIEWDKGERPDELFKAALADPIIYKRGHYVLYDALVCYVNNIECSGPFDDTRILAYLEDPFQDVRLKSLVRSKLNREVKTYEEVTTILVPSKSKAKKDIGKMVKRKLSTSQVDRPTLINYATEDVENCDRIRNIHFDSNWYKTVEQPLTDIIFRMEKRGMKIDAPHLQILKANHEKEIEDIKTQFPGVNLNSPVQVLELIRGLDAQTKNTQGLTIKKLAWGGSSSCVKLLRYRKLSKLLSTYINPILCGLDGDSRLHGSFNQAGSDENSNGTKTGRLTSNGPNLQNIPSRTTEGREVRRAFVAEDGNSLFVTDLSQIEPRLVAHFSQNHKLIKAYKDKQDTHKLMAVDIFEKPEDQITKEERFIGKTEWLADFYGCSAAKAMFIAENLSENRLPYDLAFYERLHDRLVAGNPSLFEWRQEHIENTRKLGFIETFGGRQIKIANLNSRNKWDRLAAERMAVNYLIQGSAADVLKLILVKLDRVFQINSMGFLTGNIHDEVTGELYEPEDIWAVHSIMTNTVHLKNVDIEAETKIVKSWAEK